MSSQNKKPNDSPISDTQKNEELEHSDQKEGTGNSPLVFIMLILAFLMVAVCLCAVGIFGFNYISKNVLRPNLNFPESEVKVLRETSETITREGGEIELEELQVVIPSNAVEHEAELFVSQISAKSLPVEPPEDVLGDIFAIEWDTETTSAGELATLSFSYNPKDIPEDIPLSQLSIFTFDGSDWLRVPSMVDQENETISAKTSHFSLWS